MQESKVRYRLFILFLGLMVLISAGCGFHLRGTKQVQSQLKVLKLSSNDPFGPLTRAIHEQLSLRDVRVLQDNVIRQDIETLHIFCSTEKKYTVSIFQDGSTAEYQMILNVQAQARLPNKDIYPLSVTVFYTFFDNPLAVLAKDAEQDIIRREMRRQAAEQLVHKLLIIKAKYKTKKRNQR